MTMINTEYALPVGTILYSGMGYYKIRRVLGAGGFGITYLADTTIKVGNLTHTVAVAIKECYSSQTCWRGDDGCTVVCSQSLSRQTELSRKDFISEARRLQGLGASHANIVKVNEVFEANNTAYYVMEFLSGENLREYVRAVGGQLTEQQMWSMMIPVIEAVQFLHDNRITHLDIKPDNIFVTTDEAGNAVPVLIDFGLAKHYDNEGAPTSTIGTLGLTPGYSPIEQYGGIREFSPGSDVYAIAATILFCLSGSDPVEATKITPADIGVMIPADVLPTTRDALIHSLEPFLHSRCNSVRALLSAYSDFYYTAKDTPVANSTISSLAPVFPLHPSLPQPADSFVAPRASQNSYGTAPVASHSYGGIQSLARKNKTLFAIILSVAGAAILSVLLILLLPDNSESTEVAIEEYTNDANEVENSDTTVLLEAEEVIITEDAPVRSPSAIPGKPSKSAPEPYIGGKTSHNGGYPNAGGAASPLKEKETPEKHTDDDVPGMSAERFSEPMTTEPSSGASDASHSEKVIVNVRAKDKKLVMFLQRNRMTAEDFVKLNGTLEYERGEVYRIYKRQ